MAVILLGVTHLLSWVQANELEEAKSGYRKWDRELNAVYAGLKDVLPEGVFALVREDQRNWVRHKEYMASWETKAQAKAVAADPGYWERAADLTKSRVSHLRAWKTAVEGGGWSGRFSDGYGGWLRIVEQDGKTWFAIEVVRGPTCHLGHIGGELGVNERLGRFETIADGEEAPTWLTFLHHLDGDPRIRVVGANTGFFHGARAYFDGAYLRVGMLDAAERAEVLAIAKRGGTPE